MADPHHFHYPPHPEPSPRPTPRVQSALVALGLFVVSLFVALPNAVFGLFAFALLLFGVAAWVLAKLHALSPDAYSGAVHISLVLIFLTALIQLFTLLLKGQSLLWKSLRRQAQSLRNRFSGTPPQPPPFAPAAPLPSPKRFRPSPWLFLFLPVFIVDILLIPLELARAIDLPDGALGASVFISLFLVLLAVAYSMYWIWKRVLSALWQGARTSPFFAGVVATGSLGLSVWCYTLGAAVLGAVATMGIPHAQPQPDEAVCAGVSDLECSRKLFIMAAGGTGPVTPVQDVAASLTLPPRPPNSFSTCAEELHHNDPLRGSAYQDALTQAYRYLNNIDDARDLVQATLLTVCASQEHYRDVRAYFIRSVLNNAKRAPLRKRRTCSLDEDDPRQWIPIQCQNRSPEELAVTLEMEAIAQEALCKLELEEKVVIELVAIEGHSHREVAAQLHCSEAAARQKYKRAMDRLRSEFHTRCPSL